MKITKKKLQRFIKEELDEVIELLEQAAFFRQALQQKSDLNRQNIDSSFLQNIEKKTKQQLLTLIDSLETRKDTIAKKQLKHIMDGFPYNLKDGTVNSLEDLKSASTADPTPQPSSGG